MARHQLCNREGYGSSGLHAPVNIDFDPYTNWTTAMCYNCKRPVRGWGQIPQAWTLYYLIREWP